MNVVAAPLAIGGLWFYFFHHEGRRYRLLGWMFVVSFVIFAVVRSRAYYTALCIPCCSPEAVSGWYVGLPASVLSGRVWSMACNGR